MLIWSFIVPAQIIFYVRNVADLKEKKKKKQQNLFIDLRTDYQILLGIYFYFQWGSPVPNT